MFSQIIRRELLDHFMSLRFAISCVLCFIVILCSLFVRHQGYVQTRAAHHEEAAMDRTSLEKFDHPWRIVWQGVRVHHAPNPLKIFARGVEDQNRHTVELSSHALPYFESEHLGNPLLALFPCMDLVTFVGIIMSLLAIVFGYDAICGEKERGTLRLVLSYPVPRDIVLLSKWIGGYVTLTVPFLLAVLAGIAVILVQGEVHLAAKQWLQFTGVWGLSLLYIGVVFSASVWISSLTGRAATSIMIQITLWMVLVLAIPNLSPFLAQTWRPTRDPQEVETARAERSEAIWEKEVKEPMQKYDKEHGFGEEWWRDINWNNWESRKKAEVRRIYELGLERRAHLVRLRMFAQEGENLMHSLDEQIALSLGISRLSPFSCFASAATELTDTGIHIKRRLLEQLRRHQVVLCEYAHDEWINREQYPFDNEGERPPPWVKSRQKPLPKFAFTPSAGMDYVRIVLVDTGILAGMLVLFFMLSYVTFLRYDVR